MRVRTAENSSTAEEMREFSDFLLQVGEGRHEGHLVLGKKYMKLPGDMVIRNPVENPDDDEEIGHGAIPKGMTRLIDHMYVNVNNQEIRSDEYFANRTILTTTNAVVHKINVAVVDRLQNKAREYLSTDVVEDDVNGAFFEPEVLHAVCSGPRVH
ncbi:Helitron helicase [Phytophthora megakarya]|uniref:Helitron helicase n=1 Tax=Phytophthora megakarya TaxID=4795 RepID=A0A225V9U8_9STRA|nr:Helitron helicase [Phytophthora megakarya]